MRTLTAEQKSRLSEHIASKPIKYIELYNELYDHYASTFESGKLDFETTLEKLDAHFHHNKVKAFNRNVLSQTKQATTKLYWEEVKNFWRWPQIMVTLGVLTIIYIYMATVSMEFLLLIGLFPLLIYITVFTMKGYLLGNKKKFGSRPFKSAHYKASEFFQILPLHIFNMIVIFPLLVVGPSSQKIHFYEQYPVIVFALLSFFLAFAYIGSKVYKQKIKIQYL